MFYNTKITEARSTEELYHITNSISARPNYSQLSTNFRPSDLLNLFSQSFLNKISQIRPDLDSQPCAPHHIGKPFNGKPLLAFTAVSETTVREFLNKSVPKTFELDPVLTSLLFEMPKLLLFEYLDTILPTMTAAINKSFTSDTFPEAYKTAIVKALLKKPSFDHNDLKNFLPVSNLSFVSKIVVILSHLFNHLSAN